MKQQENQAKKTSAQCFHSHWLKQFGFGITILKYTLPRSLQTSENKKTDL